MNPLSETLSIGSSGNRSRDQELPIAAVQRAEDANRPEAAAQARARISDLLEPRIDPALARTAPIVTDKHVLATQLQGARPTLPLTAPKMPQLRRPTIPSRLQPLAVAIGVFLIALIAFKLPVIISQLGYHQNNDQLVVPGTSNATVPVSAAPTLIIPKINVNAPAVYVNSNDENQVLAGLQNGVVHYANTALPGQNGNSVFFGHSSNDWWEPGNYKFVFVLLDKLTVGDKFQVDYNSVRYTYQVTATKVVDPTEVSVLAQTATPTATLITCSPPGTSWKRLVISANQIDPAPTTVATTQGSSSETTITSIPGNSPSWWSQITSAIGGLFGKKSDTTTDSGTSTTTLPNVK